MGSISGCRSRLSGCWFRGRRACGVFRDSSSGLEDLSDHHVIRVSCRDAFWKLHIADVESITFVEVGDIELKELRKGSSSATNFEAVKELIEHAAGFHASRLTQKVNWKLCGDFGLLVHGEEVRVKSYAIERVVLDVLEESELFFAADFEVDEDVLRGAVCEQLIEGLCIDLQILVFGAAPVENGGDPALAAHLLEDSGTGALTRFGIEDVLLGHDEKT